VHEVLFAADGAGVSVATVTSLSPDRAALRARNVGASEVASLFGLSTHTTEFELWMRKAGRLPDVDLSGNDRVEAGIFLEPGIAAWIGHRTGWKLRKVHRYCQHPAVPGMGASPDYEVVGHPKGRGTLQIKNVDSLVFRDWPDGQPPMAFQLQVQHEMACGGYAWGALGVVVGGNKPEVFEYDRHEAAIAKIEARVAEFWRSVHEGIEPKPDFQRDLEAIQALYSTANLGKVVDLSADAAFADACTRYDAASAREKAATKEKEAAKAEILMTIQDAALALTQGFKVSTWNVAESEAVVRRSSHRGFRCSALSAKGPKKESNSK
jgi:predicted phage-related endonuclease